MGSDDETHPPVIQTQQLSLGKSQPTNHGGFFPGSSDFQINGGQFNLINQGKQHKYLDFLEMLNKIQIKLLCVRRSSRRRLWKYSSM